MDMIANENPSRAVKVFESTIDLINKHKGKLTYPLYIDEAVNYYVRSMDEGDPFTRIMKAVEEIKQTQSTNLGLLCEVLRQAGILNGNGEITPLSKKQ